MLSTVDTAEATGTSGSPTITHGLTINEGDAVVFYCVHVGTGELTADADAGAEWRDNLSTTMSEGLNDTELLQVYKIANDSEPSSYDASFTGTAGNWRIIVRVVRRASVRNPIFFKDATTGGITNAYEGFICMSGEIFAEDGGIILSGTAKDRGYSGSLLGTVNAGDWEGVVGDTENHALASCYLLTAAELYSSYDDSPREVMEESGTHQYYSISLSIAFAETPYYPPDTVNLESYDSKFGTVSSNANVSVTLAPSGKNQAVVVLASCEADAADAVSTGLLELDGVEPDFQSALLKANDYSAEIEWTSEITQAGPTPPNYPNSRLEYADAPASQLYTIDSMGNIYPGIYVVAIPDASGTAPTLCSPTGSETVDFGSAADPAGQSITIPSDCDAVFMFWSYAQNTAASHGITSSTLNSQSPDNSGQVTGNNSFKLAIGFASWNSPSTGSQTLDVEWDEAPYFDPLCTVVYVKDCGTTVTDNSGDSAVPPASTISTDITPVADDLLLKYDVHFIGDVPPSYDPPSRYTYGLIAVWLEDNHPGTGAFNLTPDWTNHNEHHYFAIDLSNVKQNVDSTVDAITDEDLYQIFSPYGY